MVEVELDSHHMKLVLHAEVITYGNAADDIITTRIRDEIETMWNEPKGRIIFHREEFTVEFRVLGFFHPGIHPEEIFRNLNPRRNYFRIEEFAIGNISFVDGIGCNSGYFKMENLYQGSTTAAHEFGHTVGLDHPLQIDIRGKGQPGIMYPRGTWVDPPYQYDPAAMPGAPGGTMHPMHRKVRQEDISQLRLDRLRFEDRFAVLGEFTNRYHANHEDLPERNWIV